MTSPFRQNTLAQHNETTGPNNMVFESDQLREERISQANELRVLAEKVERLWIRWDTMAKKNSAYEPRANGMHGVGKQHGIRRTYKELIDMMVGLAAIMWPRVAKDMSVDTGSPPRK